jgi:hypothetical protein
MIDQIFEEEDESETDVPEDAKRRITKEARPGLFKNVSTWFSGKTASIKSKISSAKDAIANKQTKTSVEKPRVEDIQNVDCSALFGSKNVGKTQEYENPKDTTQLYTLTQAQLHFFDSCTGLILPIEWFLLDFVTPRTFCGNIFDIKTVMKYGRENTENNFEIKCLKASTNNCVVTEATPFMLLNNIKINKTFKLFLDEFYDQFGLAPQLAEDTIAPGFVCDGHRYPFFSYKSFDQEICEKLVHKVLPIIVDGHRVCSLPIYNVESTCCVCKYDVSECECDLPPKVYTDVKIDYFNIKDFHDMSTTYLYCGLFRGYLLYCDKI